MFRKLLVAMDGSEQANAALRIAVDLAQHYRASLGLLHAFPHVSDLLGTVEYENLIAERASAGEALLDAARNQVGDTVPVETQLIEGPPAQAILRVAHEDGYGMIVMGSRGRGQIAGALLGSVSHTVAQRAHCPVLIVH